MPRYIADFWRAFVGGAGGTLAGLAVGGSDALVVGTMLVGMFGTVGMHHALSKAAPREDVPEVEASKPDLDPVDQCGHEAPAETVEADVTGDGEVEVVGWLCSECGAKVSHAEAHRRNYGVEPPEKAPSTLMWGYWEPPDVPLRPEPINTGQPVRIDALRASLASTGEHLRRLTDSWQPDGATFTLSAEQHKAYIEAVKHAEMLRDMIRTEEEQVRARALLGVECEGWIEVPGTSPGSRVRRYAVPGECLCGACPEVEPEYEEVRAFGSDAPVRRAIVGGTIRALDAAESAEAAASAAAAAAEAASAIVGGTIRTGTGLTMSADGMGYEPYEPRPVSTYYGSTPPPSPGEGDMWFDTDEGGLAHRWDGEVWTRVVP